MRAYTNSASACHDEQEGCAPEHCCGKPRRPVGTLSVAADSPGNGLTAHGCLQCAELLRCPASRREAGKRIGGSGAGADWHSHAAGSSAAPARAAHAGSPQRQSGGLRAQAAGLPPAAALGACSQVGHAEPKNGCEAVQRCAMLLCTRHQHEHCDTASPDPRAASCNKILLMTCSLCNAQTFHVKQHLPALNGVAMGRGSACSSTPRNCIVVQHKTDRIHQTHGLSERSKRV